MPEINTQGYNRDQTEMIIGGLYKELLNKPMMPITSFSDLMKKMYPSVYTEVYAGIVINSMVVLKLASVENRTGTTYVMLTPIDNVKTEIFKYLGYANTATLKALTDSIPHFASIVVKFVLEKLVDDKLVEVNTSSTIVGPVYSMTKGEETVIKEVAFKTKSEPAKSPFADPLAKIRIAASQLLEETVAGSIGPNRSIGETEARIPLSTSPSADLLNKPMPKAEEPVVSKPIPVNVVKPASDTITVEISAETMEAIMKLQSLMRHVLKFTPTIEQTVAYGMTTIANINAMHTSTTGGMLNVPQQVFNPMTPQYQHGSHNPFPYPPQNFGPCSKEEFNKNLNR